MLKSSKKRVSLKQQKHAGVTLDPERCYKDISAVVFADQDPIQTTKTVFKFSKENEEVLEVIGGRFEGKLYSATRCGADLQTAKQR